MSYDETLGVKQKPGRFMSGSIVKIFLIMVISIFLFSCSGNRPDNLGITNEELAACPSSPNCVSSDASDELHQISALELAKPPEEAWKVVRALVLKLPRTRIVNEKAGYMHAECQTAVMGFVDDLELHLREADGVIAMRSASRLGYSDFGVNRKRLEGLRVQLVNDGITK